MHTTGKGPAFAALMSLLLLTAAHADPVPPLVTDRPVKVSAAGAKGPVFASPAAVRGDGADGPTTDVLLLRSHVAAFEAGVYAAGPSEQDIASYEEDDFMVFLSGGVTLTSADGTVLRVRAGEAVAVPRGWKGHGSTKGYKKDYVTYRGGGRAP